MMCRQVLPDTNGIEQIYIVKSEPGTDGENGPGLMASEDMDEIKQEPPNDDEEPETDTADQFATTSEGTPKQSGDFRL
ncbi:hypothetical protein quinque_012109 [Culex quinquefasciatus]